MEKEQEFYREVGSRVREARKGSHMTQQLLASRVSLSRASITNLEMGRQKLMLHTLVDIASELHVSLEDLVPKSKALPSMPVSDLLKHRSQTEQAWIGPALSSFLPISEANCESKWAEQYDFEVSVVPTFDKLMSEP